MVEQENEQERVARLALEQVLEDDEALLSFSKGGVSRLITHKYYIGLTETRFILLPLKRGKPAGDDYSIWRDGIESPNWTTGFGRRLRFELPKDNFLFNFGSRLRIRNRHWIKRANNLVDLADKNPPQHMTDDPMKAQQHLQQARDYQKLDFPASALFELKAGLAKDPSLGMDPAIKSLQVQLTEQRLALKVGGAFFLGNVVVDWLGLFIFLLFAGSQFLGDIFDSSLLISWGVSLWAGISLWRGQTAWRPWALFVAALGFVIFGLLNLLGGLPIDTLIQVAYSGSIILVLTGSSSRTRTLIAIVIYALGFLGIIIFQLLGFIVNSLSFAS